MTTTPFEFSDSLDEEAFNGDFVLEVPAGIQSKRELLEALARAGRFPDYFGRNWDALSDCLRDLQWISEKHIVIVHGDVPLRSNPKECKIYLDILREAIDDWARTAGPLANAVGLPVLSDHALRVLFPRSERSGVTNILAS
jgi:RNAse (barnase) inhibitor barstar